MDGIVEAPGEMAALLERVRRGEEITITQSGRPVARLVAAGVRPSAKAQAVFDDCKDLRDAIERRSGKVTWEELKVDRDLGRR